MPDHLGLPIRRQLGAGRADDVGDLDGLPGWCLQVTNRRDLGHALTVKTTEVEHQRINAGADYAAVLMRLPGGRWVAAMGIDSFVAAVRETL